MIIADPFTTLLTTMAMTLALMGAIMSATQRVDRSVRRVLAGFFGAIMLTEVGDALAPTITHEPTQIALDAFWIVGAASAMPLLWLYIWKLTERRQAWPKHLWVHAITPAISIGIFISVFLLSEVDRRLLLTEVDGDLSRAAFGVGAAFETYAIFIAVVQWAAYLWLSVKRLVRYRTRLKDVFASTHGKELRWIAAVIGICAIYWLQSFIRILVELSDLSDNMPELPEFVLNLAVSGILVIWGLRQRRALAPFPQDPDQAAQAKYAKSALTPEMAARIAAKLKRAMSEGQLHLDPNLSLWSLSKHVGVSDNYVSQVLNEEIGQNFFDFVNGYRVAAAQERLLLTDDTILTIAFDIGFNSRSSFYTAFKKSTGQTPMTFRKGTVRTG